MKRQILATVLLSVLASSAFALPATEQATPQNKAQAVQSSQTLARSGSQEDENRDYAKGDLSGLRPSRAGTGERLRRWAGALTMTKQYSDTSSNSGNSESSPTKQKVDHRSMREAQPAHSRFVTARARRRFSSLAGVLAAGLVAAFLSLASAPELLKNARSRPDSCASRWARRCCQSML